MLGIIDYGMGNLGSVFNACEYLKLPAQIVEKPEQLRSCDALILPGVGAFGDCMKHLNTAGFVTPIRSWISEGRPFLGICLGLQALYESSEESPGVAGLSVLPGKIVRFTKPADLKVPQIGWNRVAQVQRTCPLFKDVPDRAHFYFDHSFYVSTVDAATIAGTTDYGIEYPSVVARGNVLAVQFHPEKSQKVGLKMLQNFSEWAMAQAGVA